MYKLIFILLITVSCRQYEHTVSITHKEKYEASELRKLQKWADDYAKEMDTWSEEYRKWFIDNFFYIRGKIIIPTEPTTPPPSKY